MAQQFVYLPSNLQELLCLLLLQNRIRNFDAVRLPIRLGDLQIPCQVWPLHFHRFKHQHRLSKVPLRSLKDGITGWIRELEMFSLGDMFQTCGHLMSMPRFRFKRHVAYFVVCWCGNTDEKTSTPDRSDDLACAVSAKDQTHVVHVFLHRSTQSSLCISSKSVCFVDDDDCFLVDILPSDILA